MLKVAFLVAISFFGTNLHAQEKMSAKDLIYICDGTREADKAFCQAYIAGVSEGGYTSAFFYLLKSGIDAESAFHQISTITRICYDGSTTIEQVVPKVIKTIKNAPDLVDIQASVAVTFSLQRLLPCS